ncbi:MAG: SusC/RagA family TonB-linked outer membrane protein [Tannerella sp.]|nr:SusC/RagA family TonB-linked outer membrane protein [Tannerella sp.]
MKSNKIIRIGALWIVAAGMMFPLCAQTPQTGKEENGEAKEAGGLTETELYRPEETVRFGYSSQPKGAVTGAVSTVSGKELESSPVANLSQSLAGRLTGLFTEETYSEPSRVNTTLRVRGANTIYANQPLVVIDGFPYAYNSNALFEYISAYEVESVSVLKDASAQAIYGIQGANGVIVITTKRGRSGKLDVDVRLDQTFEQPTTQLPFLPSGEYVQLRNEAGYNDGLGRNAYFSPTDVEGFVSGENRELYPNNDWRQLNMRDVTQMQRVGVDLTGGNDRAVFYSNFNVMHQNGMWKTYQTKYNANNDFLWANFRSNVDVQLHKALTISMNLSGNIKREKTPGAQSVQGFANALYYRMYTVPSYVYGPTTPKTVDPETGAESGDQVVVTATEPYTTYSAINRMGYINHSTTNIYAQFAAKLDLGFLTQGLNLSGYGGYQTNSVNSQYTSQTFERWVRTPDFSKSEFTRYGTDENTPLAYSASSTSYYNLNFKGILDYHCKFGIHDVSAMAYGFYQDLSKAINAMAVGLDRPDAGSSELLPYRRISSGVEAAYGYDGRYLLKVDMGYSGSEQYARENRFTATPAVSAGWVLSNEAFMKSTSAYLTFLKLRASWGKAANDLSNLGRYIYLDNIALGIDGVVSEGQAANPDLTPEISVKQNYGIDVTLFNSLSLTADVFREKMTNMVSTATAITPTYQGIPLGNFPRTNTGVFENKGYELSADFAKQINSDFSFSVGGWLAYAKNKVIYNDESERAEDFAYRKRTEGFSVGQTFGYLVDDLNGNGFFNSQQELDGSGLVYEIGAPRVGDLKYRDLNSDGIINDKDLAPLGSGNIPRYYYAFHAKAVFRDFDLNVLFQGIADYHAIDMSVGRTEYSYEGVYSEWHKQAWTAERYAAGEKITYPALATRVNANHQANSFFLEDRSYLRLKNVELGYTFPENIARLIRAEKIRLTLSGQNLFTRHKLTTDEYGPEGNYFSIPVYKLYNIGLSVKF